jgi:GNAT superfamily N-acetyltransferase
VTVEVRRLVADDLAAFQEGMPSWNSTEYAKRLEAQGRGELVQVVAWEGGRAIGKAMLLFPGHDEYSASAEREGCAEIRDVSVLEDARRRGIGTAVIVSLEAEARVREMPSIGMAVAVGEDAGPGEILYGKLGYRRAHGPFITSTNLWDDACRPIPVGAVMVYLVKPLV